MNAVEFFNNTKENPELDKKHIDDWLESIVQEHNEGMGYRYPDFVPYSKRGVFVASLRALGFRVYKYEKSDCDIIPHFTLYSKPFKNPVCKGSLEFQTACLRCERCTELLDNRGRH